LAGLDLSVREGSACMRIYGGEGGRAWWMRDRIHGRSEWAEWLNTHCKIFNLSNGLTTVLLAAPAHPPATKNVISSCLRFGSCFNVARTGDFCSACACCGAGGVEVDACGGGLVSTGGWGGEGESRGDA
jgi:hypothetical protein